MFKKDTKIPKSVELTSLLASYLDSTMDYGDEISITSLASQIELVNGSNPHVHTTEKEMRKWLIIQRIAPSLQFIEDKEKGIISRIRKIEPSDVTFKKEIRNQVINIQNQIDKMDAKLDILIKRKK